MNQKIEGARRKHSLPTIRTKLALVVLACVVTTLMGFGLLIGHFYERERIQIEEDTLLTARAMVHEVDRDLNNSKIAALSLATSPSLATNNLAAFHAQAKALLSDDFPGFNFVLTDQSGQQLVNTIRRFGEPLPLHGNPDQIRRVFQTAKPVISDVYVGGVLHRPVISVDVPVFRDDKVVYALSAGILPERLGRILTEQHLQPERVVAIFDSKGVIVARTHEPKKFVGQKGATALLDQLQKANEGEVDLVTLEGIPVHSIFSKSATSNWTVAIGIPRSTIFTEALHSLGWISWVVAGLIASGFVLAWYFGGAISRSVKALASPDMTLRDGGLIQHVQMSFKEAEEVAAELSRHRNHLELLVDERTKELKKSKNRLADSERFIRAVTDNLPGLVAYWDTELRCRFANQRYLEWFNKTPEEMIGMHIRDLLGDNLFAQNEPYLQRTLQGEQQNFERTLTKTSGEVRYTWASYIPDVDANGVVVGMFVLVSDVTELKRAEEEQRIAATAFEAQEAMMITDTNGVILRVNQAFTEVTGYPFNEIVGQTPRVLKSSHHDAAFYKEMWDRIHQHGSWQGEIWDRYKNGRIAPNWMTITAVKDANNTITHYVSTLTDITLRKKAEDEVKRMAFFDSLTGLPNRRLMMDRLQHIMATSSRTGHEGALMFIDLDKFKLINDTLGHDIGDLLLQQVAGRLSVCVREGDTVASLGGDEFVVIMEDLSDNPRIATAQAKTVGEKILAKLNQPYDLAGNIQSSTPSIGITLFSNHKFSIDELLKQADIAMYQAKAEGRNALCFFNAEASSSVAAH
ncbi:MAG: diguanylate cyclase domain-containing protein [Burkholderiaceae bacterium]